MKGEAAHLARLFGDGNFIAKSLIAVIALAGNRFFDGAHIFRRESNEFDADTHSRQAVTDFGPCVNFDIRSIEAEAKLHDRTFGKAAGRINEHALCADVRWAERDFLQCGPL